MEQDGKWRICVVPGNCAGKCGGFFSIIHVKGCFVFTIMCVGAGLLPGAAAEQYEPSSCYSINVIIARHESSMSSEGEAHARLFFVYRPGLSQSEFDFV